MSNSLFSVQDKTVVVTGALGQLGRQFSLSLLKGGAKVALIDIADDCKSLPAKFSDYFDKSRAIYVKSDVTSEASLQSALLDIEDKLGLPFGLINNAALDSPPNANSEDNGPFETFPLDSLEKTMGVNIIGVAKACQIFGSRMAEIGVGSIINIGSIYGMVSPDQSLYDYRRASGEKFYKPVSYSISKSAIYNLTRYLATYWSKNGVRVNTLTFGGVFNNQDNQFLTNYQAKVPLGRMANEDEYNGAVIFLLSQASSYMTGSNMVIDGGWTAW